MNKNLYTVKELDLFYNTKQILKNLNFSISANQKIGLVGINGSGKSSLLKVLAGELELDNGKIYKPNHLKIKYLSQNSNQLANYKDLTIENYILPATEVLQNPDLEKIALDLAKNFNLPDWRTKIAHLSGGQVKQLLLLKVLASQADLLLLDEPTNHLDFITLLNLQNLLKNYAGAVLVVSHDRYFLDKVVEEIWEINNKNLYFHPGNYSQFLARKKHRQEVELVQYEKRKQELKRELAWVNSGVKARGTKDQGRLQRFWELEKLHQECKPQRQKPQLPIPHPAPLGNKILILENFSVFVPQSLVDKENKDKTWIIRNLNLEFTEQMRLGILGPNGSGKTTFIRAILGEYTNFEGKVIYGQNSEFNYQDQQRVLLEEQKSILEIISNNNIYIDFGFRKIDEEGRLIEPVKMNVFAYLKKFLFLPEDLHKTVQTLSGGQKARLFLAKILKQGGNFLVLDEPTNDLDADTLEALENTLLNFKGCAIIVSHDRFFLDQVCTHILALEGGGNFTFSTGNYSDYIAKYKQEQEFWSQDTTNSQEESFLKKQVKTKSQKDQRKLKVTLREIEKQLQITEQKVQELKKIISEANFYQKPKQEITQILEKLEKSKLKLSNLETQWLELSLKIEEN